MLLVPPDLNGYIGADLRADGAARARAVIVPDDEKITLTVDFLSDADRSLGTGDGAEGTPFASLFVDFDFGWHHFTANENPITKSQIPNNNQ